MGKEVALKTGNVPRLSIEDLRQLLAKYQGEKDKYYQEAVVAKAQVYDLKNMATTSDSTHLKVRIYDLEREVELLKKEITRLNFKLGRSDKIKE